MYWRQRSQTELVALPLNRFGWRKRQIKKETRSRVVILEYSRKYIQEINYSRARLGPFTALITPINVRHRLCYV